MLYISVLGEHCWQENLPGGDHILKCGWGMRPPIFKDYDFLSSWDPVQVTTLTVTCTNFGKRNDYYEACYVLVLNK